LLIAEAVAEDGLDCEFNSIEFLYETFILYWCIPVVAFIYVSTQITIVNKDKINCVYCH